MELQLFRRFTQLTEINEIAEILESNNIIFKISRPVSPLNSSFGSINEDSFELYIGKNDFTSVKQILKERAELIASSISSDYYLFTLSNSELKDILYNPNDWNELDVFLSAKILNDRQPKSSSQKTVYKVTNKQRKKSIPFETKDSPKDELKYYAVLIVTVLVGALFTLYVKAYHSEITDTHIAIVIAVLVTIIALYYEYKYPCPKCHEKFNTERVHRLEQGDIAMPSPYNVLERFKCHNCGKVWDKFSEESLGD